MGRPATVPKKFKDGFYIEVCNKGSKSGIKIWCKDKAKMLQAKEDYSKSKSVILLGEHKNGKWLSAPIHPAPSGS